MNKGEWGKIKAFFDVKTEEGFVIKGFKLVQGINGLFVGNPSQKGNDNEYYDTIYADKELKDIRKFCEYQLKNYLEEIEGANTDKVTLRITQSWLNKTKPGEYHSPHYHSNSYLSGVFYFNCLPNDHINFNNRMYGMFNNMEFPKKKVTVWNAASYRQNVKEGDLILFPSGVTHYVDLNETKNRERISLSFNTFPIGEMGKEIGSHLKL